MISVVGHTTTDHLFTVPELVAKNHSTFITAHKVFYGGGAANIAAGIAMLGGTAELVTAVGGDFAGSDYDHWLTTLGVLRRFIVKPEMHSSTCYLFNDGTDDQTTYFEWGASEALTSAEAPVLDRVHLAPCEPDFCVRVAEKASWVSFDPGQDLVRFSREQIDTILRMTNQLFVNRHEAERICTIGGFSQEDLISMVPRVIITQSADGSFLYQGGEEVRVPSLPVTLVDPTGAGDAFRAGFLTAEKQGYDPVTAMEIGTTVASFVVEKAGCQTNLPDWERMAARYRTHFGALPPLSLS
ncbi:MAG: carbohydrate kinase family protein [Methanomicrobiales archaeon]|jgi:ribokinase|nr:carbohydrate kinase family protein [Methanomicrobiales archaeon]